MHTQWGVLKCDRGHELEVIEIVNNSPRYGCKVCSSFEISDDR